MSKFKVGDVCVYIDNAANPAMEGAECTITGFCDCDAGEYLCIFPGFPSRVSNNLWCCFGRQLRLRRPPSWDRFIYGTSGVDSEQRETA